MLILRHSPTCLRSRTVNIAMWALSILIILVFFGALYVTRFIIIIYTVNTNRGNVLQSAKKRKLPIKTMIVAGSGNNFFAQNSVQSVAIMVFGSFGNEPMQSCSVRRVSLSSVSASSSASVYSPPSDRFDHRSFISYKYMQLCP